MSSSSAVWNLRLKRPEDQPFIGKFSSKVNFENALKPVKMYLKDEEIREEFHDEEEIVKDGDYYKMKKKSAKRRKYSKTSKLVIEDKLTGVVTSDSMGIGRFEGQLVDLSLDDSMTNSTFSNPSNSNNNGTNNTNGNNDHQTDGLFRYALLEVVGSGGVDGKTTEVNVIPVHNMFYFRRPALTGDKLLDEIDDDYDEKIRKDKLKLQRYKRIGKALEEWESREPGSGMNAGNSSGLGDDDDTTSTTIPSTEGSSSASIGKFIIPALFGSLAKKSKSKSVGSRRVGMISGAGLADEDQVKELNDEFRGDYSARFVDDEEDNVVIEQNYLNAIEDQFNADRETVDVLGIDNDEDEEDEEDEDEDEITITPAGGVVIAPSTSIAGIDSEELNRSTRVAREFILNQSKKRSMDGNVITNSTASALALATNQFPIVKPESSKSTLLDSSPLKSKTSLTEATQSSNNQSSNEFYDLSETGIRSYIMAMGGSVPTTQLKEAFKPQLKKESKKLGDKTKAQSKFLEMILAVTKTENGMLTLK